MRQSLTLPIAALVTAICLSQTGGATPSDSGAHSVSQRGLAEEAATSSAATSASSSHGSAASPGSEVRNGAGVLLLGMVVFILTIFCMVHSRLEHVQKVTHSAVALGVGFFLASVAADANNLLANFLVSFWHKDGTADLVSAQAVSAKGEKAAWAIFIVQYVFIILGFLEVVILLLLSARKLPDDLALTRLAGWSSFGGKTLGLLGGFMFGCLCNIEPFNRSPGMQALLVLLYGLIMFPTYLVFRWLCRCLYMNCIDWSDKEGRDDYTKSKMHGAMRIVGRDFLTIGSSFLLATSLSSAIRFHRAGEVTNPHAAVASADHTATEAILLLVCGSAFSLLGGAASRIRFLVSDVSSSRSSLADEAVALLARFIQYTGAWCMYWALAWFIMDGYTQPTYNIVVPYAIVALIISLTFVIAVHVIVLFYNFFADSKAKGSKQRLGGLASIALAVGIAWGRTLQISVWEVAIELRGQVSEDASVMLNLNRAQTVQQLLIMYAVLVFMLPAWMLYMNSRDGFNMLLWDESGGSVLDDVQKEFEFHNIFCVFGGNYCIDEEDAAEYDELVVDEDGWE